jgi:hypothetical protein
MHAVAQAPAAFDPKKCAYVARVCLLTTAHARASAQAFHTLCLSAQAFHTLCMSAQAFHTLCMSAQAFHTLYHSDGSVLLGAPTGSREHA